MKTITIQKVTNGYLVTVNTSPIPEDEYGYNYSTEQYVAMTKEAVKDIIGENL